jgi:hypothetical protein
MQLGHRVRLHRPCVIQNVVWHRGLDRCGFGTESSGGRAAVYQLHRASRVADKPVHPPCSADFRVLGSMPSLCRDACVFAQDGQGGRAQVGGRYNLCVFCDPDRLAGALRLPASRRRVVGALRTWRLAGTPVYDFAWRASALAALPAVDLQALRDEVEGGASGLCGGLQFDGLQLSPCQFAMDGCGGRAWIYGEGACIFCDAAAMDDALHASASRRRVVAMLRGWFQAGSPVYDAAWRASALAFVADADLAELRAQVERRRPRTRVSEPTPPPPCPAWARAWAARGLAVVCRRCGVATPALHISSERMCRRCQDAPVAAPSLLLVSAVLQELTYPERALLSLVQWNHVYVELPRGDMPAQRGRFYHVPLEHPTASLLLARAKLLEHGGALRVAWPRHGVEAATGARPLVLLRALAELAGSHPAFMENVEVHAALQHWRGLLAEATTRGVGLDEDGLPVVHDDAGGADVDGGDEFLTVGGPPQGQLRPSSARAQLGPVGQMGPGGRVRARQGPPIWAQLGLRWGPGEAQVGHVRALWGQVGQFAPGRAVCARQSPPLAAHVRPR